MVISLSDIVSARLTRAGADAINAYNAEAARRMGVQFEAVLISAGDVWTGPLFDLLEKTNGRWADHFGKVFLAPFYGFEMRMKHPPLTEGIRWRAEWASRLAAQEANL